MGHVLQGKESHLAVEAVLVYLQPCAGTATSVHSQHVTRGKVAQDAKQNRKHWTWHSR